jgi:regulator of RNase E activity RraA
MAEHGGTIECGGLRIRPGDYVFGDRDGVVVIPKENVEEAIERARTKMARVRIQSLD